MPVRGKFNHIRTVKLPDLKTVRKDGKRFYVTPKGNHYPSVTTVVGSINQEGLKKWREKVGEDVAGHIAGKSASIGSKFHKIIEDYLNNLPIKDYKELFPLAHFNNIKPHLDRIDRIRKLEAMLWSDVLKLGGRVDCIAEYEGRPSIIDFKTSKKQKQSDWIESYFLQGTAYSEMWKERSKEDINQIVVLVSGEDGSKDAFVRDKREYLDRLKEVIDKYFSNQ